MKPMITVAAAVAVSMFALAGADSFYANPTNDEQYLTNARLIGEGVITNRSRIAWTIWRAHKTMPQNVLVQLDQLMSTAPDMYSIRVNTDTCRSFPETSRLCANAIKARFPAFSALLLRKLDGDVPSAQEYVAGRIESLLYADEPPLDRTIVDMTELILSYAPRAIRVKLRSEGKAITEKDGADPVGSLMAPIAEALNAPRFSGLRDALGAAGIDAPQPEFSSIPTAESGAGKKFLDAVFIGDIPMDSKTTGKLRYMLGTDGYNAFVERYNGGTR